MENRLVVGIMNIVEDKLREFNIQIPDDDREDSKDPIVGYQYAELHDRIKEYLEDEGVIEKPYSPPVKTNGGPQDMTSQGENTLISYLYRDADNYKVSNECVIKGILSKEDQKTILECLHDGEYFIPSQVGLPEERFDDGLTEADHCWFELDAFSFETTSCEPNVEIEASELVKAFCEKKDKWDDFFLVVNDNQPSLYAAMKPALDKIISSASDRAGTSDSSQKAPEPER